MKSRNGLKHWLFTGLALFGGANLVHGQTGSPYPMGAGYGGAPGAAMPGYPGGAMPGGSMAGLGNHGPMSISMPGPPPGELAYRSGLGPIGGPTSMQDRSMQDRSMQDRSMQGGPMQGGPMQGGPMQGGPMQGGPMQGGPMQGGPMQGGPMQGGAMQAAYMQGAPGMAGGGGHPPGCACCSGATDTGAYRQNMVEGAPLCKDCGGTNCMFCSGAGCENCGGARGCRSCGTAGGRLGCAPVRNMLRSTGIGAHLVGTDGCMACGWGNNALCSGRFAGLLGRLAPFSEGPQAQRWYDFHIGTMALARTDTSGGTVLATQGISGTPALRLNDPSLDRLEYGLTTTAAMQVGAGSNLELTYFGLNKWDSTSTATSANGDLFSVFSDFGVSPPGGFDDTDRSIRQSLRYRSAIHNAELNYRRRWVAPARWVQGSWLGGLRYFDLDESLNYQAVGFVNNGLNNTQRFFNLDTQTRNDLVGFQLGSDVWMTVIPGFMLGAEGKYGVYGNHAEVNSEVLANSVPLSREGLTDGQTAYLGEIALNSVYRLTYSWAFRASYNYLRVDNVALAPRNFNSAGLTPDVNGLVFGSARTPFIDVNGVAKYSGFSLGAEYLW